MVVRVAGRSLCCPAYGQTDKNTAMTHQQLTDAYWEAYLAVLSSAPKLKQPLSPETLCAYANEAAKIAAEQKHAYSERAKIIEERARGFSEKFANSQPKAQPEPPTSAMKYPPCSLVGVKVGDKIEDYTGDLFIVSDIEEDYVRVNNMYSYYHNGILPIGSDTDTPYNAKRIIPAGTESPERQYTPCDLSEARPGDKIEKHNGDIYNVFRVHDFVYVEGDLYFEKDGTFPGGTPEHNAKRIIPLQKSAENQYAPCSLLTAKIGDVIERWDGECVKVISVLDNSITPICAKRSNGDYLYYGLNGCLSGDLRIPSNARRLIKASK